MNTLAPAWTAALARQPDAGPDDTVLPPAQLEPPIPGDPPDARFAPGAAMAAGCQGEVRLALQPDLGREVVIKTAGPAQRCPHDLAREARITAALDHPQVCAVHDAGPGWIALRRERGRMLGEHKGLTAGVEAVLKVADALAHAHERGWVHRDCKPANILVADHGRVAVLDWGIAAPVGALSDPACGSPAWLAPEAARAEPLSVAPALDSWGLGALLHHLLTGRPPHAGASAADAVAAAARWAGPPPLPGPPALAALAAAGLDPDPARRPTAAAVADRLRAWLERSGDADAAAAALAEAEAALAGDGDAHHRHQTALAAVERAVALAPDHPGAAALADRIRIAWARLLVAGGDLTLAADLLADAGANAPGRAEATTALAAARAARTAARVHDRRRRRWLTGTMATVALIVVGLPVHHLLDDHAAARERRQQAAALLAAVPAGDDLAALLARAEAADRARGLDPHGPAPRTAQAAAHAALATWAEREGLTAMARFHRERAGR